MFLYDSKLAMNILFIDEPAYGNTEYTIMIINKITTTNPSKSYQNLILANHIKSYQLQYILIYLNKHVLLSYSPLLVVFEQYP